MSKNLRTTKMTDTAQTLYHLRRMAVMSGWDERDIGRVVDKLVRTPRRGFSREQGRELLYFGFRITERKEKKHIWRRLFAKQ